MFVGIVLGLLTAAFHLFSLMSAHGLDCQSLQNPRGGLFSAPDLVLGRQFSASREGVLLLTLSCGTIVPSLGLCLGHVRLVWKAD